ncbi:MAG: DUF4965 domain-containing protein [Tannerellaceae bacterium]|jgi:hypothetical protein|nr:DUF4965 domain-containing protein [Tannerellaceae bacterium]
MKFYIPLLILLLNFTLLSANNFFEPAQKVKLRAPSVPIITCDPYLSIWSPYDKLTEGNTEHWTGKEHSIIGAIRVDGITYRFMGKDRKNLKPILPMTYTDHWEASYTTEQPADDWMNVDYDDSEWKKGEAAFATRRMPRLRTTWSSEDIWIRRTFDAESDISAKELFVMYSHDDLFQLYLNGEKLIETDYYWSNDMILNLKDNVKKKLRIGKNVLAAHCHNRAGDGYVDFGLFYKDKYACNFEKEAIQQSLDVLPTQTFYTFTCGPVELKLVFTAPLLLDDLDLVSTPINYISYQIKSLDKKKHDVQIYFEITPELAVHEPSQFIMAERMEKNDMLFLKTGTIDQPYTKRTGDGVRIDWGYAYLASGKGRNKSLCMGDYYFMKEDFIKRGKFGSTMFKEDIPANMYEHMTALSYIEDFETIGNESKSGFLMLGYDDVYSIEYFYKRRLAYWKHEGEVDIFQAFERANKNYTVVMQRCKDFDKQTMADALQAGGSEYAELCTLAYRQAIAAHKIIKDDEGNILFLSKENHSNGCINTVDITYPSSPLFLIYNTELMKGMLTSIFYFSESGRWTKPYPAHDLGTYPIANGQLYGGDMPVEESGNMILLTTAISLIDDNAEYAKKHWEMLTLWVNYLVEKGFDPENQLSTDDFAGRLAHNTNLSIKAIMAIAGYAKMAEMLGMGNVAQKYSEMANNMAIEWEKMANNADHYRLAFDKPDTWSQKYNLIWDKIFDMNVFPSIVIEKEIPFYLAKQNKYGLPLDVRKNYTKSDWVMWSACLAPTRNEFNQLVAPIYKYANETPSRIPLSDWHDTETARHMNFKARSVVGGYFMKLLEMKVKEKQVN